MKLKIAVLSGDGIGPEVCEQAVKVLKAIEKKFKHKFVFTEGLVGGVALNAKGTPLPEETLQLCHDSDAILFGAIGDPKFENSPDAKVRPEEGLLKLRKELGLYANIRPLKVFQPLVHKSPIKEKVIKNTDFIIFRELTGGIYYGDKETSSDGTAAADTCEYSIEEIDRIAHMSFKSS